MEVYPESIYHTNFIKEEDDDGDFEDALSLCDLPIYSGSFESSADDFQCLYQEEDQFEFFSFTQFQQQQEEDEDHFTTTTTTTSTCAAAAANDIIFCGKLIPYKTPQPHQTNSSKQQTDHKKKSIFSWNSTASQPENTAKPRSINNTNNKALSTVLTSQTKSRWNLFMFGLTRIPTEMELSDIRNRQHRRTQSSTSSSMFGSFEEDNKQMKKDGKKKRGKGLWGLLKVLGCTSYHTNTVVKASFGCISSV